MTWTAIRRAVLAVGALAMVGIAPVFTQTGIAQTAEVKVGLIAPMSGPWARQGDLMIKGANLAVENINKAGGIKALGGAKLKLLVFDAGDSVEKAKNAAQRMVAQEPDLVGATGAWLSSFTLGVTEVTERAELPLLTLSYSDLITSRGFKYVFQTSPTGGAQALAALPALVKLAENATGKRPKTVAIVMDNTGAPVSFAKPMREGGIEKLGLKLVVDEIFTPPLSDATPLIQKVRSSRPDLLLLLPTAISDDKMCLEKLHEFGLGRGRVPVISNGAHIGAPDMLKNLGKDLLEGVMTIVANWGAKGQEDIVQGVHRQDRRALDHAGFTLHLRRHPDSQGGAGEGRRRRPPQGGRGDPRHGHHGRAGEVFPRPAHQVRRERPPRGRRSGGGAVAERRSGDGLPAGIRRRPADLAEVVIGVPLDALDASPLPACGERARVRGSHARCAWNVPAIQAPSVRGRHPWLPLTPTLSPRCRSLRRGWRCAGRGRPQ